ncbi:VOC family protein [Cellulomonas wangsupingiae]|uniref:VOC family protein n=1 Tax=Cellulomonas wangsupingiae TaxID=2968085 RepID=UPI001D0E83D1|nr:VOC family protein [Cellulomonas wangsupingiae]MCM0641027.1 VOC family protein [Cellulomonas wangsupingiae]
MSDDTFGTIPPGEHVSSGAPRLRATSITIGTPRPHEAAQFYARLLGGRITALDEAAPDEPHGIMWAMVKPLPGEAGMTINLEHEREWSPPVWPARPGEQRSTQHLDIQVDDLPAAVAWALECGAREASPQPQDDVRVMLDPDGHPFCLFL